MDKNKDKKNKPLKLSSSGRLQIRKNLGPSGDRSKSGNNKKTIQIVFRNKNNQQKSSSTAKSNFRGSSTFRTNTQVTPGLTNLNKNKSTLLSKADSWEFLTVNHTSEHMFAGGTLKILEIFLSSKVTDEKFIKKMIDWLKDQQMENSFFPKIANKHPIGDIAVTNRVLEIFKKYYKTH